MKRLTFEGNFCEIAQCAGVRYGSDCEDGACSQRKVWERLKALEDRLGDEYDARDVLSRSELTYWIITTHCAQCECEFHGDRTPDGCFGCKVDQVLRKIAEVGGKCGF